MTPVERTCTWLTHGKSRLALWTLRGVAGHPLVLLHGLGEASPHAVPHVMSEWPGPVYALDFTGHGHSTIPIGGGYTAEMLMGDVDAVVAHLGPITVCGRGIGAYVALLIAGGRPAAVRGAILCDGPGLAGGGVRPGSIHVECFDRPVTTPPDPFALAELSRDVRPPDYALEYVRQAVQTSDLPVPLAVCTVVRPEWIDGIAAEPGVRECAIADALEMFADAAPI